MSVKLLETLKKIDPSIVSVRYSGQVNGWVWVDGRNIHHVAKDTVMLGRQVYFKVDPANVPTVMTPEDWKNLGAVIDAIEAVVAPIPM